MPYARNADLPSNVKNPLPGAAQTLFRRVVNGALNRGLAEERAFASAWAVVRQQYKKPAADGKWVHKRKATLYNHRKVENAHDLLKWAKEQGFKTTLAASDLHATIAHSDEPVDWPEQDDDLIKVRSARGRQVSPLGENGAVVLKFYSPTLTRRWAELCEHGCAWRHDGYTPHITITYDAGDLDLSKVQPYTGPIELGPEVFDEVDDDLEPAEKFDIAKMQVFKVDKKHGLIFGWAIISKVQGEEYYDLQGDHIPEDAMFDASVEFMQKSRKMKLMHKGEKKGDILFAWPLTTETAKAMGLSSEVTGLMIAAKPMSKKILDAAEDGTLTGFSIGGRRIEDEMVEE